MSIIEQTLIVREGGRVALQIPRRAGSRVRVIVQELLEKPRLEAIALIDLQSQTGFAREVLSNHADEV